MDLFLKGLIESDSLKRAIRPKMVYYAMQNLVSVFDDNLQRIKHLHDTHNTNITLGKDEIMFNKGTDHSLSVYGYEHKNTKKQVFTIWFDGHIPSNKNQTKDLNFSILNANMTQPVYVDILTGGIYEIPENQIVKKGIVTTFKNLPVYDAPILIADKSVLKY